MIGIPGMALQVIFGFVILIAMKDYEFKNNNEILNKIKAVVFRENFDLIVAIARENFSCSPITANTYC